jgi:L,D-transpeptidase YcbB
MPGVRLDRFLASTALVLLLSAAAAGGVLADPMTDPGINAAIAAPDTSNAAAPRAAESDKTTAKPTQSTSPPETPARAASANPPAAPNPAESTSAPETPAPAASTNPPATPNPAESTSAPETPAPAASTNPPATPNPAESTSAPETPAPAASTNPPATPNPAESTSAPETPAPAASTNPPAAPNPAESTSAPNPPAAAAAPAATASPAEPTKETVTPTPAAAAAPAKTPETAGTVAAPAVPASAAATAAPTTTASPAEPARETQTLTPAAAAAPAAPAATPETSRTVGAPAVPIPAAGPAGPAAGAGSAADAAIAEQLHQLASGKFDHIVGGKIARTSIEAFYSGRNYAPLWITDGQANARAKAVIAYLAHVDADGLDPADYPVRDFTALSDPAALAEAELRLTASVITYAHHAAIGRVHWSRVSADIEYKRKPPEPTDVLAAMVEANDVGAALAAYEPHAPSYLALKAKLAQIRAGKGDDAKPPIPNGPVLKVGAHDDRVPQLRERLGVLGGGGTTYDKALAAAVKKFQHGHGLKPTGMLTTATIEALNGRRPDHEVDTIIANMERWRWMPHDLGKTYVIVNIPDFTLRVMHDGKQVWMTKIVVGKPGMPTPIMTAEMKFITINPTWNVPPSIVNNEYLPALAQDPTVMERMGLKVGHDPDGTVHIWQPPGDRNALGRIRFNFPNKFLVYQHDTPDKYMFAYAKRAFSHGCMRVLDPPKYAEVLLSLVRPGDGYTIDRIKKMYGPNEINIDFPAFIPVHLTYQTAFVDGAGKLEFREDIYGRDRTLLALLNGDERKVADIPIERKENPTRRAVLAMPDRGWGGGPFGADGQNFFTRLFGAFASPQPAPPRRPVVRRRRVTRTRDTVER